MRTREPGRGSAHQCPFCGAELKRPGELSAGPGEKAQGGSCTCGAVYLVDPTGKNVGELMSLGLTLAAEKLSKDISDLTADEDYEDAVLSYDWRTHRSSGPSTGHLDRYGRLYIIKVKEKPR